MSRIIRLPQEILANIVCCLANSARCDNESLVPYTLVCRRFQCAMERYTCAEVRLRASRTHSDLIMFKRVFGNYRRRSLLRCIELDFALRATEYHLPEFLYGSEEQRALFAMLRIDARHPPRLSHAQFEAQLAQDNIRMSIFLAHVFSALNRWFGKKTRTHFLHLRIIAETPTY
ncbi:hypothetical protein PWT90_07219 [Aphanocladium album]|nr:hypothetical protein PWT90_07219 [Aphanocladium album]